MVLRSFILFIGRVKIILQCFLDGVPGLHDPYWGKSSTRKIMYAVYDSAWWVMTVASSKLLVDAQVHRSKRTSTPLKVPDVDSDDRFGRVSSWHIKYPSVFETYTRIVCLMPYVMPTDFGICVGFCHNCCSEQSCLQCFQSHPHWLPGSDPCNQVSERAVFPCKCHLICT